MGASSLRKQRKELGYDPGLRTIFFAALGGLIIILIIGGTHGLKNCGELIGLSIMVSLAASLGGGILGFLFGIPKSLQSNEVLAPIDGPSKNGRPYSNNTNLEQISDWLTKIIVGVSLTQIPDIRHNFDLLSTNIANGFGPILTFKFAYVYSGSIIVFYLICGFLSGYLYARVYLFEQLISLENSLFSDVEEQGKRVSTLEIRQLRILLFDFNRRKEKILTIENSDEFRDVVAKASPGAITYLDDCQKGRWGEKPTSLEFTTKVIVSKNPNIYAEPFIVKIIVKPVEPTLLAGNIYFFLHDSYDSKMIRKIEAVNGIGEIEFPSYEAFTVGIYIEQNNTKLEIDLNKLDHIPSSYKYLDDLITIDQLNKELEEATQGNVE